MAESVNPPPPIRVFPLGEVKVAICKQKNPHIDLTEIKLGTL
jgi:hypothetical protein